MEIRHILGKINPVEIIPKQVKPDDQVYSGEVNQLDKDIVDVI